jgi:2-polyprenyl-3-methyl-5-hydroxy-6-metoxy-1,4-benzoquinol methylase
MSGCCPSGTDACFSKSAGHYARRYRRRGLDRAQKELRKGLLADGVLGKSLLDVGCGVGGLLFELMKDGGSSGVGIDLSEGMIGKASAIARDRGVAGQVRFQVGDFAAMEGNVPKADIVVMDKVLCCYPEPGALLARVAATGAGTLAVSYPRDGVLSRFSFTSMYRIGKLLRWSFYPFYHDPQGLDALMAGAGFRESRRSATPFWQIVILQRAA